MKKTPLSSATIARLFAAAIALAVPTLTFAQGQIDTSRANEASNRLGSGGRNGPIMPSYYSNAMINNGNQVGVGNALVTGNVTQGRAFQGNVGYGDPYAFRGTTAGSISDNFIKNSTGAPQAYTRETAPNQSTLFYGQASTVQAPPGFVQSGPNGGGYVPPPATTGMRGMQDQRLGVVDLNQPISPNVNPNELVTRGSLNPQATSMGIITGSALYGVREWNPQDPADRVFLENLMNRNNAGYLNRLQIDPRQMQKMRDEVLKVMGDQPINAQVAPMTPKDSVGGSPLTGGLGSPSDPSLVNRPLGGQVENRPLGADRDTEQGMRNFLLGSARRTSTQYTELNKRLTEYYTDRKKTDVDFAREFNESLRAKQAADKAKAAKTKPGEDTTPKVTPEKPAVTPEDPTKPRKKPQPLKVNTLSQGIKAEGLANVMKNAEKLMKDGKYATALDQYDAAESVAPNNPMIWLGRAHAELGAGFFQRADNHLRQAYMTDKALMMGQYDLTTMLGEERLGKLVAELKDLANKDTKPLPAFLLAYVAYNTGHERQALGYLDLAEKRADGKDVFYKMVREHWALPDENAPEKPKGPELNK